MQSARGLNAQQHQETMIQTWTVMNSKQSNIVGQLQPKVRQDSGVGQQNFADNSKRGSLDSSVSDSSLNSEIQVRILIGPENKSLYYYPNFYTESNPVFSTSTSH
jgi:hypothetical protein